MARRKSGTFGIDEGLFEAFEGGHDGNPELMFTDEDDREQLRAAEKNGVLHWINPDLLDEDPDNRMIYGDDYDTDGLAQAISEDGFKGVIRAYPSEKNGHYTIESGHRSVEGAKKAGLERVPVILSPAPADDVERRERLYSMNLHLRKYTPMMRAREVDYVYRTEKMRREKNKEAGIKPTERIHETVAAKCEISESQVTKFRRLLSLIPSLQKLADSGEYSWSALAEASSLDEKRQEALFKRITGYTKLKGAESVSRTWIKEQTDDIASMKLYSEKTDLSWMSEYLHEDAQDEAPKKRFRSSNGAKAVVRSSEALHAAFSEKAKIHPQDIENTISILNEMREFIDGRIKELEAVPKKTNRK